MKQKYAVVILFVLIVASGLTSFGSYRATEKVISEDMSHALSKALAEQQSDVISTDTIRTFNSYLKLEQLRGNAVLAVTTRQEGLRCEAKCSAVTIFSLSDQRPASVLWTIAIFWGVYCFWSYRKQIQQLMEMFFRSESHQLTKTEICDALWPKKDDANDTLYTLIRRLKPIIEEHSDLKIESDRGRAYKLEVK